MNHSAAMPSSSRNTFLKRYGWLKIFLENFIVQSITLYRFRKWQIFDIVGGKGGHLFEEFLLSSIVFVLSQFCVSYFFLHSQARRSSDFKNWKFFEIEDYLIWKWAVLLEHCWQVNPSVSCHFLCHRSTKKRLNNVTHKPKALGGKEEEILPRVSRSFWRKWCGVRITGSCAPAAKPWALAFC